MADSDEEQTPEPQPIEKRIRTYTKKSTTPIPSGTTQTVFQAAADDGGVILKSVGKSEEKSVKLDHVEIVPPPQSPKPLPRTTLKDSPAAADDAEKGKKVECPDCGVIGKIRVKQYLKITK